VVDWEVTVGLEVNKVLHRAYIELCSVASFNNGHQKLWFKKEKIMTILHLVISKGRSRLINCSFHNTNLIHYGGSGQLWTKGIPIVTSCPQRYTLLNWLTTGSRLAFKLGI